MRDEFGQVCNKRHPLSIFWAIAFQGYRFHSFKRCVIYTFHYTSYVNLDLRTRSSGEITNDDLILLLQEAIPGKIVRRSLLCELLGITKNTFRKYFRSYIESNGLERRRVFTIVETYQLLNYWQENNQFGSLKAIQKKLVAEVVYGNSYKKMAIDFGLFKDDDWYKNYDKYSPGLVEKLINEISEVELNEEEKEKLFGHKEHEDLNLWFFGICMILLLFLKNREKTQKPN